MAPRSKRPEFDLSSELEFEEHAPELRRLTPRLREDADIVPQTFGGEKSFVLQDPVTLQFYRVREPEREILEQLDGQTTLGEIHRNLRERFGGRAPSFRDLSRFIFMLRHANLIVSEGMEESRWAVKRADKKRKQRIQQKFSSFMYLTIPLLDPERFLEALIPYLRWIYTRAFFVVWLLTILAGLAAFAYNAGDLTRPVHGILAPSNLPLLWIAFVLIKACHEFGHAFTAKNYGAEVHRMGIMFLIFMPVLYVDTTPVWAFPRKWPKVVVGCSGMMAELFIASWALFGWLMLGPGALRSVLYNMVFIASVSTILFNGNPLLRYDGYYILADVAEIPSLRSRSTEYLKHLLRRYVLGERIQPKTQSRREKRWFVTYGILAGLYRCFIVTSIILFIASHLFFLGVAIAAVVGTLWIVIPAGKMIHHIFLARETRPVRLRAVSTFVVVFSAVVVLLGMVPLTAAVRAPCALEPHELAVIRAQWPGFLSEVEVENGQRVDEGEVLAVMSNEELDSLIRRRELDVRRSAAKLRRLATGDQAAAQAERYHLSMLRRDLEALREKKAELTVRAPFDGRIIAPELERVRGRFLQKGERLFAVAALGKLRVTTVVDDADVAAVRSAADREVRIKFSSHPDRVYTGTIERLHPSATHQVPPLSLTDKAGGPVLLDPEASGEPRALLPWYRVDVLLEEGESRPPVGTRGTARFRVGREPLSVQIWLRVRRMLHRRFLI